MALAIFIQQVEVVLSHIGFKICVCSSLLSTTKEPGRSTSKLRSTTLVILSAMKELAPRYASLKSLNGAGSSSSLLWLIVPSGNRSEKL